MRALLICMISACLMAPVLAQDKDKIDGPANEKAQKTFKEAHQALHEHRTDFALDDFKKADKQDDGHCHACQEKMVTLGIELGEWKTAELGAQEMVGEAHAVRDVALAHYDFARVLMDEGLQKHKDEFFTRAHEELAKALAAVANFPDAVFTDGRALAQLHQDDAAKARFGEYVKMKSIDDAGKQRALLYVNRPKLARARMAPPFSVTALDGRQVSMDDLQGKVVLLDFWATWCGPCREALPHIRDVAKKFQGQPLVILSVSLDSDEQKWKDFIAKNDMTWLQYRDGGFTGRIARLFEVNAIPHTFTIDSDGVLQEEHIGDASIEGKLKKLIARAREVQPPPITASN
jgi:thiol-disulfide isomerase/thioredoxin